MSIPRKVSLWCDHFPVLEVNIYAILHGHPVSTQGWALHRQGKSWEQSHLQCWNPFPPLWGDEEMALSKGTSGRKSPSFTRALTPARRCSYGCRCSCSNDQYKVSVSMDMDIRSLYVRKNFTSETNLWMKTSPPWARGWRIHWKASLLRISTPTPRNIHPLHDQPGYPRVGKFPLSLPLLSHTAINGPMPCWQFHSFFFLFFFLIHTH